MNNTLRTILIALGVLLVGVIALFVGFAIGRASFSPFSLFSSGVATLTGNSGINNGVPMGPGMMGYRFQDNVDENFLSYGHMGTGHGWGASGMMGGGFGMMGFSPANGLTNVDPLTLAEAQEAVEDYLARQEDDNLRIGEIMIFDNHAYAQIVEEDSGIGAMEVLVDPITLVITPEHGPNMMWNLKYSPMHGFSGFGMRGMMGNSGLSRFGGRRGVMGGFTGIEAGTEMTIDPAEAVAIAQDYLSTNYPGTSADEHADAFYGYYTLHILKDGEIAGMLSVNGYSGQVFTHTWHGDFVEMTTETDH